MQSNDSDTSRPETIIIGQRPITCDANPQEMFKNRD